MAGCNIFQIILVVCLLLLTGSVFSAPTQNSTVATTTAESNCTDEYCGNCTINCLECVGPEKDQCRACEDGYELYTPVDGIDTGTCNSHEFRNLGLILGLVGLVAAVAIVLLCCCLLCWHIKSEYRSLPPPRIQVISSPDRSAYCSVPPRRLSEFSSHDYRELDLESINFLSNKGGFELILRSAPKSVPSPDITTTLESIQKSGRSEDATLTHLQKILRWHESLVADFNRRDKRKKVFQLPYIAISYFDEDGGSLALEAYNVHLYIPRGAIPLGDLQKVYIYVNPSAPPTDGLNPADVALAPMIQSGPTGLNFQDSVVLMFPHYAQEDSGWKLQPKMCLNDESSSKTWQPMDDEKDGTMVSTKNRKVTLLLKHFTGVTLTGQTSPDQACSKIMEVGVFGPRFDLSDQEYAARIYMWNDDPVAKEKVLESENGLRSRQLDAIKNMIVLYTMGDVEATIKGIKDGWQLDTNTTAIRRFSKTRLWKYPTISETFDFERTFPNPDVFSCHGKVSQLNPENTENPDGECVPLSIKPKDISRPRRGCNCGKSAVVDELCGQCKRNLRTSLRDKRAESRHGDFVGLPEDSIENLESAVSQDWIQKEANYNHIEHPPRYFREMLKISCARGRADGCTDEDTVRRLLSTFGDTALQQIQRKRPVDNVEDLDSFDDGAGNTVKRQKLELQRSPPQPGPSAAQPGPSAAQPGSSAAHPGPSAAQPGPSAIAAEIAEEQRFRCLAKDLGPEWERLATYLGFSYPQIKNIKKNILSVENQIFDMLMEWRQRHEKLDETFLKSSLEKVDRYDLAHSF